MKITEKALKKIQDIERFFYFGMTLDQEVKVSALASEKTRDAFIAYVKYFNYKHGGFLGGFKITISDDEQTIRKSPAGFIDTNTQADGNHVVDVERYQKKPNGLALTVIDKYKDVLKYGDT